MLSRLYSVEQQNTPGCTGFEYTPAFKLAVVLDSVSGCADSVLLAVFSVTAHCWPDRMALRSLCRRRKLVLWENLEKPFLTQIW